MPPRRMATSNVPAPANSTPVQATSALLALTPQERTGLAALDEVQQHCTLQAISSLSSEAEKSIVLAKAITAVQTALDPFKGQIESLKNNPLGFLLDKPEDYDWTITRRIVAEAVMRGARITGNEFNGIAKRCYLTQAYFLRQVKSWPGLKVVLERFGVPRQLNGQTVVDYRIEYQIDGQADHYTREGPEAIPVRVNNGMGPDAIIGKAKRKAYAGLLEQLINRSGSTWSPGTDGDVGDAEGDGRPVRQVTAAPAGPRIDVESWNGRITAADGAAVMTVLGRELMEAADVRNGMWSEQDRAAFATVFTNWLVHRLALCTTTGEVQAVQATLEAVNNIRRLEVMNELQTLTNQAYQRCAAYPQPARAS